MKQSFIKIKYFLLSILFLISCQQNNEFNIENASKDGIQSFEISLDKDTVLKTKVGIQIKIEKGTFKSEQKSTITLLVNEAIELSDMILGDLTTMSDGKLLSSDGMFNIDALDKEYYTINKKIKITIPGSSLNEKMKLFKGIVKDGKINWVNPQDLFVEKNDYYIKGKKIYDANCTSCHEIGNDRVGPDLAHILKRRDYSWLVEFTKYSQKVIKIDNDPYARCLYNKYNNTEMTSYADMKDEDMKALYDFIQSFSEEQKINYPKNDYKNSFESCLKKNNLKLRKYTKINDTLLNTPIYKIEMNETYQVFINEFGWYNIDIFFEENDTNPLFVRIFNDEFEELEYKFTMPKYSVVVDLNKTQNYYYIKNKNSIEQLIKGEKAILFAYGKQNGNYYFASNEIVLGDTNTIRISPIQVNNKKEIEKRIKEYTDKFNKIKKENLVPAVVLNNAWNEDCDCVLGDNINNYSIDNNTENLNNLFNQ